MVILTADIHFGVHGRLQDISWATRVIREYAKANGIENIFILGDLFHDRKSIEIDVMNEVIDIFADPAYDLRWITFPGNHDMFLRHSWKVNSLKPLHRHLTVIEDVKIVELDGQRYWILPFIQYEKAYNRVLKRIEDQYQEGDVLLTHIGVNGAILNTCFLMKDWESVNFSTSKFKHVFTGHFHSKQQVHDNVWYPGSPIPFKFDEGDVPHGFYVFDPVAKTLKFVNIWKAGKHFFGNDTPLPPQFTTIMDDYIIEKTKEDVDNAHVRVALQREYSTDERKTMLDRLMDLGARSVRFYNLYKKLDKVENPDKSFIPQRDLFDAWVKADKNAEDLDRELLNRLNFEVTKEGDEIYDKENDIEA
jgi:DNA repair exonuclease SbcCD nuclease subunit